LIFTWRASDVSCKGRGCDARTETLSRSSLLNEGSNRVMVFRVQLDFPSLEILARLNSEEETLSEWGDAKMQLRQCSNNRRFEPRGRGFHSNSPPDKPGAFCCEPRQMEGFAVTCPLAPDASRLISGFCSSPRSFGLGFLQTPPHDDAPGSSPGQALALLLAFALRKPGHRTCTYEVTRHARRTR
jgi:hypothetical protein